MDVDINRSHEIKLRVPFHDLDPMQVVWHGNYLKYFDQARFALFENLNADLHSYLEENKYIFPVIKTSIKYISPLRFNDEFLCKATVIGARHKIIINFEIRLTKSNTLCAKGRSEQVAVKTTNGQMVFKIPDDIRTSLGFCS